jgi:hypothetical protein
MKIIPSFGIVLLFFLLFSSNFLSVPAYSMEKWEQTREKGKVSPTLAQRDINLDDFFKKFRSKYAYEGPKEWGVFSLFIPEGKTENDLRTQGIKIHISAKPETAGFIASIILPYLIEKNIFHKVVPTNFLLDRLYEKPTQVGKFITIYPESDDVAKNLAERLDHILVINKLKKDDFVPSSNDKAFGRSGGVYYRYGLFKPTQDNEVEFYDEDTGEVKRVPDDRKRYKPEGMGKTEMSQIFKKHDKEKLIKPERDEQKHIKIEKKEEEKPNKKGEMQEFILNLDVPSSSSKKNYKVDWENLHPNQMLLDRLEAEAKHKKKKTEEKKTKKEGEKEKKKKSESSISSISSHS